MKISQSILPKFLLAFALFFAAAPAVFSQNAAEEYGTASYYSDKLHGRRTASGEVYDKNALTCAHKSLPFGTKIRVTRFDDKRSVVVRVNDRGPYTDGYIVDLSRQAAEQIGLIRDGVTKVKIEVLDADDKKPAAPSAAAEKPKSEQPETAPTNVTGKDFKNFDLYSIELKRPARKGFGIQVMSLSDIENVLAEIAKLQSHWPGKVMLSIEPPKTEGGQPLFKIIVGPFSDRKSAEKNQRTAAAKGYKKCFVVDLSGKSN